MEYNKIYQGDALDLIDKTSHIFDLIIMSPPDLAETSYNLEEYKKFLYNIYTKCAKKLSKNGNLVSITTDRKKEGTIYTKHIDIINALQSELTLFNYKIWAKTLKSNLYILTYSHILAFRKNKTSPNHQLDEYRPDVLLIPRDNVKGYKNKDSFPTKLIELILKNYSNEGALVLDPFIGSGKTMQVCKLNNRNCIGFELDEKNCNLANKRINETNLE